MLMHTQNSGLVDATFHQPVSNGQMHQKSRFCACFFQFLYCAARMAECFLNVSIVDDQNIKEREYVCERERAFALYETSRMNDSNLWTCPLIYNRIIGM